MYCAVGSASVYLLKRLVSRILIKFSISSIIRLISQNLSLFTLAAISYVLSFTLWILVIRQIPLTIAIPVQLACLTIIGYLIDHQSDNFKINTASALGVLFVLGGILLLLTSGNSIAKH